IACRALLPIFFQLTLYSTSASFSLFFFHDPATTEIYTLSLHDALPISRRDRHALRRAGRDQGRADRALDAARAAHEALDAPPARSEEHTSELQSRGHLVCRLLLEKKKNILHVLILDEHRVIARWIRDIL